MRSFDALGEAAGSSRLLGVALALSLLASAVDANAQAPASSGTAAAGAAASGKPAPASGPASSPAAGGKDSKSPKLEAKKPTDTKATPAAPAAEVSSPAAAPSAAPAPTPAAAPAVVPGSEGVPIESATDDQKKAAQGHYEAGAKAFSAKNFDEAYAGFASSYRIVKSPNAHLMMARSLAELAKNAEAFNELIGVEAEAQGAERYRPTLERAAALRNELASKVSLLTVRSSPTAPPGLQLFVDQTSVKSSDLRAYAPGRAVVRGVVDGRVVEERSLDLVAGQSQLVELSAYVGAAAAAPLPPPVAPVAPPPTQFREDRSSYRLDLVVAGAAVGLVGLGGLGLGAGLQAGATSDYNELAALCRRGSNGLVTCPNDAAVVEAKTAGEAKQLVATVGFIAGGTLLAGGAALLTAGFLLTDERPSEPLRPQLEIGLAPGWVGLRGTFE